jgi:hypothetical protein
VSEHAGALFRKIYSCSRTTTISHIINGVIENLE